MDRLNGIRDQFLDYAEQFGQTWNHIPFIYVHLKSAFLAQQESNAERAGFYYQVSRIDFLKNWIARPCFKNDKAKCYFNKIAIAAM